MTQCKSIALIFAIAGLCLISAGAKAREAIFTVAKYPVEATGANAVAAKRAALDDGRNAAFRSLLKRLVPTASYGLLERIGEIDPSTYLHSERIRSEENSSTQYIATIDFSFDPLAVRSLLQNNAVPYVDIQAPTSDVVLFYSPPPAGAPGATRAMSAKRGGRLWHNIWTDLDLANATTPLKLAGLQSVPDQATRERLLRAEPDALAGLARSIQTAQLIIVEAAPNPARRELAITLAGQDAVGRFALSTRYSLSPDDFAYSLELAAVIAQGILEGRWKSRLSQQQAVATPRPGGGPLTPLQVVAEFNNLGQWQHQQQVLAGTPGVSDMQIGGLSGRSATIALRYPGGGSALQAALQTRGVTLENINGFWILR